MKKTFCLFFILTVFILYCNKNKDSFSDNLVLNIESEDNDDMVIEFNTKDELSFLIENEKFVISTYNPDKDIEIYFEVPAKIISANNYFLNKDIKFSCALKKGKNKNYFISEKISDFSVKIKKISGFGQIVKGFFTVLLDDVANNNKKIKINGNFELKINTENLNNIKIIKLGLN